MVMRSSLRRIGRIAALTALGGAGAGSVVLGTFFFSTRKSKFVPMYADSDPIFQYPIFQKHNRFQNPTTHDLCIRKLPLDKIKKELLDDPGALCRTFCAALFSGPGYRFERWYFARKYQSDETVNQLWTVEELRNSDYHLGEQWTDHFEVVHREPNVITTRCGGSPRNSAPRARDGLFEMSTHVNEPAGEVEFHLKYVCFYGRGKMDTEPLPQWIVWLHKQYTKLLMETAISAVKK